MARFMVMCVVMLAACGEGDAPVSEPDAYVLPDAADPCNTIEFPPAVAELNVATAPPIPQGGAFVPGRYGITTAKRYTGVGNADGPSGAMIAVELDFDGTSFVYAHQIARPQFTLEVRFAGTFVLAGTMLTTTNACPDSLATEFGYDASPTELTLYNLVPGGTRAWTYTKQ